MLVKESSALTRVVRTARSLDLAVILLGCLCNLEQSDREHRDPDNRFYLVRIHFSRIDDDRVTSATARKLLTAIR